MARKLKVESCIQTCSACPSQWDIQTTTGEYIYVRYRWGGLTLTINAFTPDSKVLYSENIGDGLDGVLSTSELIQHTSHILDWSNIKDFSEMEGADNDESALSSSSEESQPMELVGWIAKDEDGNINIFDTKPERQVGGFWMNKGCYYLMRDLQYEKPDCFPLLKWEDEPRKVKITIIPITEQ